MSDSKFVNAYVIETGEKQRIPRHWLDHPTLGARFRLTPKARARAEQSATPDADHTSPDAPPAPDLDTTHQSDATSDTETPAAGD